MVHLLALAFAMMPAAFAANLDIYWIDVDGGGATLLVTPARETVLIDSGENKAHHVSRMHEAVRRTGLSHIDHHIITHWHADHYGGAYELAKRIPIRNYYAGTAPPASVDDDPQFTVLMPLYRKANPGKTRVLSPGEAIPLRQASGAPAMSIRVLGSNRRQIAARPGTPTNPACAEPVTAPKLDDGENAMSVVLMIEYGKFRFLNAGDLTWHVEERLACPTNLIGKVDLYQVTHHGLDRSNNPHLVRSIQPRVAVVNNGLRKGSEPNSMRTVLNLANSSVAWALYANPNTGPELNPPSRRIANPTGSDGGQYLRGSVQPGGAFLVQIGEDGYKEEYR